MVRQNHPRLVMERMRRGKVHGLPFFYWNLARIGLCLKVTSDHSWSFIHVDLFVLHLLLQCVFLVGRTMGALVC